MQQAPLAKAIFNSVRAFSGAVVCNESNGEEVLDGDGRRGDDETEDKLGVSDDDLG